MLTKSSFLKKLLKQMLLFVSVRFTKISTFLPDVKGVCAGNLIIFYVKLVSTAVYTISFKNNNIWTVYLNESYSKEWSEFECYLPKNKK